MRLRLTLSLAACLSMMAYPTSWAASTIPAQTLAQITRLAKSATSVRACEIVSFQLAYYGLIPGSRSHLAVGITAIDGENCGGTYVDTALTIYRVAGSYITRLATPADARRYNIQKIDGVTRLAHGLDVKVSYFGPGDPMCCARHQTSLYVAF